MRRREMNKYDNARGARVTDALLNYETVKCFGNEALETANLETAILDYQRVEYKLIASLNGLNVLQSVIIFLGLIAGLVVCTKVCACARAAYSGAPIVLLAATCAGPCVASCCVSQYTSTVSCKNANLCRQLCGRAWLFGVMLEVRAIIHASQSGQWVTCTVRVVQGVAEGRLTVGDAVLFITLMQQLYAPLNCAPCLPCSMRMHACMHAHHHGLPFSDTAFA
jgi:ABC-type transport system involved in Fe-S cluster assembly fused permease/ATPase subunit